LKCGAGEGWRRSVGSMVLNKQKLHRRKEERKILKTVRRKEFNFEQVERYREE
jgi:hypothetical protein